MKDKYKTKDTEYGEGYGNGYEKAIQDAKNKIIKLKQELANKPVNERGSRGYWLNRVEEEL